MPHNYKTARKTLVFDFISKQTGTTNVEIAEAIGLSYRTVRQITQELEAESRVVGRWNHFGGRFSNVSWWAAR
jgi:predicted transcriptional regulator